MGKYDKYANAVKEEITWKGEQERLHDKHDSVPDDTVIIETGNMGKFMLNFIRSFLNTVFAVILILLATVGILTLIYPEPRGAFINVINIILEDLKNKI